MLSTAPSTATPVTPLRQIENSQVENGPLRENLPRPRFLPGRNQVENSQVENGPLRENLPQPRFLPGRNQVENSQVENGPLRESSL